jgi:S-adenosylmethionine hydrolase
MKNLILRKSINRSPLRRGFAVIALVLACFALSPAPKAFGVTPAPDGGYPGQNTAEGDKALFSLPGTSTDNTAIGYQALYNETTGSTNTAVGANALFSTTNGTDNTAIGVQAMYNDTFGNYSVAIGESALYANTTGGDNVATGYDALESNTTGYDNVANGYAALDSNSIGHDNTADGFQALDSNTTGSNNIALGSSAGANLTTGVNNIDIGNAGVAAESKTIRIGVQGTQGATFVAGIYGVTASGGAAVYINSSGQLGTATSSARFKRDIQSMDTASETILALRPVTFRYKPELDPTGLPQFGLVAEDVEKVNPALVVRDADGKPYSVRYEAVNAMLLNEFLKEHRTVQAQEATITQLKSTVAQQQRGMEVLAATLKEQASQIQKVSAQFELSKSTPQMAGNNR